MAVNLRIVFKLLICSLLLSLSLSVSASNILSTNDLVLNEDTGVYSVVGSDPFFTIYTTSTTPGSQVEYLHFDLQFNQVNTSIQLFFKESNGGFDPQHTVKFTAPNAPFFLKIPDHISVKNSLLRIDLEQCRKCQFSFNTIHLNSESEQKIPVQASSFKNGSVKVDTENGLDITATSWTLNDLEGSISSFMVSGEDPYFASGQLDTSTQQLGGVYFKLKRPASEHHDSFQLFYATENNSFTQKYTSIARLAPNDTSDMANTEVEILFPLDYLSNETPRDHILTRVRLDLPVIDGNWALLESKLVHKQQLDQLAPLIPSQIIKNKRQRLKGKALMTKVLRNIWADKLFAICYSILLILITVMFIKAYRK